MDESLKNYIDQQRASGESDEAIYQSLITAGWEAKTILPFFPSSRTKPIDLTNPVLYKQVNNILLLTNLFKVKKILGVIFSIVVVTLLGIGYFIFKDLIPNIPKSPSNHIIAYEVFDEQQNFSVHFYDPKTNSLAPGIPELENEKNASIQMGSWSPNGRYLPILAEVHLGDTRELSQISLYLYDAETQTSKVIYDAPASDENNSWSGTSFGYATGWIDNERLILEKDYDLRSGTTINGYITVEGEIKKEAISIKDAYTNSQLKYFYDTNYPSVAISQINVGDAILSFKPEGKILGLVNGTLATIVRPQETRSPEEMLATLFTQPEQNSDQTLSEEELYKKALELSETKGDTFINFYNTQSGAQEHKILLSEDGWYTQSILVNTLGTLLIAHQTDSELQATKERFISISPSQDPTTQTLFEKSIETYEPSYASSLLYQGSSFFLTTDGESIIAMTGSHVDTSGNSTIYTHNIKTGEEKVVCTAYCFDVKAYYPLKFRSLYEGI